ncbi:guanylate kinase [[Clostridium] aminophilum]|uniref:guanylate kinase n=1 Tax=[Clostridium] aminophilum TaxID=1526 RepID=UPI003328323E
MDNRGVLAVISGFSGSGKGTLMKALLEKYDNYALSVSWTTRKPREGEEDGVSYFFRTQEEFDRHIEEDGFLEYARYVDHSYGTPKQYVFDQLDQGKDVLLEIEMQGALQVKEKYPDTVLIFVTPPSAEELKRRLVGRGTEDMETIKKRLARADEESKGMEQYDYLLVNDSIERCAEELHGVIMAAHARMGNHLELVNNIKEQMKQF